MPIPQDFKQRAFPLLPKILKDFRPKNLYGKNSAGLDAALSPGFHLYDEKGIRERLKLMKKLFFTEHPGMEFFAVKANPNNALLKIIKDEGFGLDCSSPTEIVRATMLGFPPEKIMCTGNNTNPEFYEAIMDIGCILNLDDISYIDKLPYMPERICFRYNPGSRRSEGSNEFVGNPASQKYGVRHDNIIEAYRKAKDKGAKIFGIHTMYATNCLDEEALGENSKMQLEIAEEIQNALNIKFEFINIGGGIGIEYRHDQKPLDAVRVAEITNNAFFRFKEKHGYAPLLYLEYGRWITGPFGILAGRAVNRMNKYKNFMGVDFCDWADIARMVIYPAYHEVSVLTPEGKEKFTADGSEVASLVGPLCENRSMVSDRVLPKIEEGDIIVVHDTGAHGLAMKMNYNGWTASQELLLHSDNSVTRISRAETIGDLLKTELDMEGHELMVKY
ncbi:MAG: diaminopimelate decarboxylase [Patescibacteria group bacterium]|jgi:diaminopimelate decarboxylase